MAYIENNTLLAPMENMSTSMSPTGLQFFISYINVLEGAKSKIKNLHWVAKNLPNSDKRGAHLYLDDFLEIIADFQDTIAESSSGILGEMNLNAISGVPMSCTTPKELIDTLLEKTISFYEGLPSPTEYVGIKSETEVFIKDLTKYKYLFRLTE